MNTKELKVARIGNSRGVRLPARSLKRYAVGSALIMEERPEGILLRPAVGVPAKLSWEDTAREMAASDEDWSEWDALAGDGLGSVPWAPGKKARVGEKRVPYGHKPSARGEPVKRYEIRWADLDPARGAEMAKRRPVVVVSLDALNERLETVTVCPLTSRLHPGWRSRVPVRCAGRAAEVAVDQIRTLGKSRLGARIGSLSEAEAAALRSLITEMYGE
ncbi:MAG TPA: type II toxin-antitoxin system PemK/MazF family toxin [Candidatus Aminicenantes bacterium]|nr:type II toxin-antitoxin system PemK/MazF family toxin [Candidatus Aminicenantes bacterium]